MHHGTPIPSFHHQVDEVITILQTAKLSYENGDNPEAIKRLLKALHALKAVRI